MLQRDPSHLFTVVEHDGSGPFHDRKHHDSTELPPHRNTQTGKCRKLLYKLQQLLCLQKENDKMKEKV